MKLNGDHDGQRKRIGLGKRMRLCSSFPSLGVLPNWSDYDDRAREAIRSAEVIYYPTRLYEPLFRSVGKKVFPRNYYDFMGHKIRQTDLFVMLNIAHPKTRLYRGKDRAGRILRDFDFPFVAKDPVGSSQGRGVWLIRNLEDLGAYLDRCPTAYIQQYLAVDRDLRVVVIAGKVLHAYWRIAEPGEFRNNVSLGGRISFEDIDGEALLFAERVAALCRFDEVALDICLYEGVYWVLEANMAYGVEGFRRRGLDVRDMMRELDRGGYLP